MRGRMRDFVTAICCAALVCGAVSSATAGIAPLLNEFEPNPPGPDPTMVPFEFIGAPNTSSDLWVVSVEGDLSSSFGLVDRAAMVSVSFDSAGIGVANIPDLENPAFTVILTDDFTGTVASTNIDPGGLGSMATIGDLDLTAFGTIFDALGVPDDGDAMQALYGSALGGVDLGFIGSEPELAFREGPAGLDAFGGVGDWFQVDFNDISYDAAGVDVAPSFFLPNNDPSFGFPNPTLTVPEPVSGLMLLGSLFGLFVTRRR